ncbi:hypothetical protein BV20DRAFT_1125590 [Pilatotrama ljubarskyi]|nr:hypothetical protein BV20DRAFT_1125590 [Pilatotrama ljubarskyi]
MELLDLPDDILIVVFSNIHGEDALNVVLTSKRLACLALPRVAAVIECWKPSMLRRLHAYMLSRANTTPDAPLRAIYLRKLKIEVHTFSSEESDLSDTEEDVTNADAGSLHYGSDFSQAHLIGDLLLNAPNLQELDLERFQPQLSLDYFSDGDYPLPNETKTLPALLTALARFRNLGDLELWTFTPLMSYPSYDFAPPQFPSVTHLRLSDSSPPALDIVGLCPNISTLVYRRDRDRPGDPFGSLVPRAGPRWPPLKRLLLGEHGDAADVLGRLSRVERLHITGQLRVLRDDDQDLVHFLELLHIASPVDLYVSVLVQSTPVTCWSQIARNAPRLRVLEVKIEIPHPWLEHDGWLDDLPEALRSLSIPCLRIFVPRLPLTIWDPPTTPEQVRARWEGAREMELRRAESMRTLPQRLADALPSLRYLALLDGGVNKDNLNVDNEESDEDDEDEDGMDSDTWDELRREYNLKSSMWWRVMDGASGRILEPISVKEGERAQEELVEGSERDAKNDLTERLPLLSL